MKIKLVNGKELAPLMVTGGQQYVQGQNRDTLNFIFDENADMTELDQEFQAANCGDIIIIDDQDGKYLHHGYVIRYEMKKSSVESKSATTENKAEYVTRVTVSMAQRTYAEEQMDSLLDTVDMLVLDALGGGDDNV